MPRNARTTPARSIGLAFVTVLIALCVTTAPAAAIDRFQRCTADTAGGARLSLPAESPSTPAARFALRVDDSYNEAERLEEPTYSERWLEVQYLSDAIEVAMRASSARKDYFGMGFDPDLERTYVYVRNRKHDRAIHHCARQLGIDKYVRIVVHRWSKGQLLGAIKKTIRATEDLYDDGVFECSYGAPDYFNIDVYKGATDRQVARIRKAAKATKVAFRLRRLDTERSGGVLQ